jgi:PAS domain S-box-containing protein
MESMGIAAYVGVPLRLTDGTVIGAFCVVDTTPRRWRQREVQVLRELATSAVTEIELRETAREAAAARSAAARAEARFTDLVHGLDAIVWEMDAKSWRFTFVSRAAETILGYPLERWTTENSFWQEVLLHPEDREWALEFCMSATEAGRDHEFEYRAVTADGALVWLHDRVRVVPDSNGRPLLLRGVMMDITESRRVRAELQTAEAHYRRLVANAPYAIYAIDPDGRFTEVNAAACEMLQRDARDLIGMDVAEIVLPEDRHIAEESLRSKRDREVERTEFELRLARPSGEIVHVHVRSSVIEEDGRVVGSHGIARDITEERARNERMQILSMALENLDEGVSIARFDGQLIYANAAHGRLLGFDPGAEVLPNSLMFAVDETGREELTEILRTAAEKGHWFGRVQRRRLNDGTIVPVEMILGRVDREAGTSLLFSIARDITQQLEQEERLRRAERLASLGTLIGGVAHELNNPLHAITNFTQLLLMEQREEQEREDLEIMLREAQRMAKIVSDLRLIARRTHESTSEREHVDLNGIVEHVLRTRGYSMKTRNIDVRLDLGRELAPVLGDPGELEQVILNLVVNAEQAMVQKSGERRLTLRTRETPGVVVLEVTDNGPGIPKHLLERIFDPFFTTKGPGEGTGLGLSLVHTITTEHGGEIRVENEPGGGARFRIELPAADEGVVASPAAGEEPEPARILRVLVVDDEESVRRAVVRYLRRRGHEVREATEGEEALRMIAQEETHGSFDVILSDLRMPGLGGEKLMQRLRERGGDLARRVVFLTGDAASPDAARLLASAETPVLIKPTSLTEIGRVLEQHAMKHGDA